MKSNPLFHDSTVTQGANVQTQFELTGVELKDRQALYLKLIVDGNLRCLKMSLKRKGVFHSSVWIEHRKSISYQFFIQMGDELLYASNLKTSVALHIISEVWKPVEGSDWKKKIKKILNVKAENLDLVDSKEVILEEDYLDDLIEKWGL